MPQVVRQRIGAPASLEPPAAYAVARRRVQSENDQTLQPRNRAAPGMRPAAASSQKTDHRSRHQFLLPRENAEPEPALHSMAQAAVAGQPHAPGARLLFDSR